MHHADRFGFRVSEVRAAILVLDLQEDYSETIAVLPEAQEETGKERSGRGVDGEIHAGPWRT